MITILEAIDLADAYLLRTTGHRGSPNMVRLIRGPKKSRVYTVVYGPEVFDPSYDVEGTVTDGGEYILRVDAVTGEVTRFVM